MLTPLTQYTYTVSVLTDKHPLKVTLTWFDPPNPEFAARVLVHDLDLLVFSPSGSLFNGNAATAGTGERDELNNVSLV